MTDLLSILIVKFGIFLNALFPYPYYYYIVYFVLCFVAFYVYLCLRCRGKDNGKI